MTVHRVKNHKPKQIVMQHDSSLERAIRRIESALVSTTKKQHRHTKNHGFHFESKEDINIERGF